MAVALGLSACANGADPEAFHQAEVASDPLAMVRIADAAEQSGDSAGALAFYRRAAELDPTSATAQIGIARSLTEQGSVDEAIDTLNQTHAREPSNAQVDLTLGRLLVASRRPVEAVPVFQEGLRQDPRSVPLLIGQGVALDAVARHDEAQKSYEEALRIDPGNVPARKDLALSKSLSSRASGKAGRQVPSPEKTPRQVGSGGAARSISTPTTPVE